MGSDRKKIIYLITKANWGGAQKYVFDIATSLPKEDFDVLVLHGQGNILNRRLQEKGVRTITIAEMTRDVNIIREITVFFKILKIFFDESPDIIHVNSSKAGGIGAFLGRLTFTPKIIFTAHGWAFNEPQFDNVLTKFFSWLTVLLSTKTIVMSKQNLEQGLRFPLVKNRFILIYNGINEIRFRERNNSRNFISDITKAPIEKKWLVTISELHKNKGLEYLIEAISKIKDKPVVFIIGEGDERDNLENLIKALNLEDRIYLMGFVEEASSYLKAFDIFTLTSIKEGHPYTILEAGLAGLPIVASDIAGVNDILDKKTGLLFKTKDSSELSSLIETALKDNKKTSQLSQEIRNKIIKEFSFQRMLKETITLY